MLVDMNAFFISCEMTRDNSLKGQPAAVAGNPQKRTGIILAANYEARKYGIKTAMTINEAKKLYPDLITVNPDHSFYKKKSVEIMDLLQEYSPVIEPNSIDEAWLDLTGCELIYETPLIAAKRIMADIEDRLHLPCSIGIANNKFLAKMASEMKKPRGITELWLDDLPHKLWPLPVSAMYGVGTKTAERLLSIGIKSIRDLANTDPAIITSFLGHNGITLHRYANGLDDDPVQPKLEDDMKSIGRSVTLPEDINIPEKLRSILLQLSDEVGLTARKHNLHGSVVRISLKFSDFSVMSRQVTIQPTNSGSDLFSLGYNLLLKIWQNGWSVRLIGITLAGIEKIESSKQMSLFDLSDFASARQKSLEIKPDQYEKCSSKPSIDQILDQIKAKHGNNSITRAALIKYRKPSFHKQEKDE